jgi:hypothetical protein
MLRQPRIDLEHGTRNRHFGHAGDGRVQRFVKPAARAAHSQIGFAGERVERLREFVGGLVIDELHGVTERDAQSDGQYRDQQPALLLA